MPVVEACGYQFNDGVKTRARSRPPTATAMTWSEAQIRSAERHPETPVDQAHTATSPVAATTRRALQTQLDGLFGPGHKPCPRFCDHRFETLLVAGDDCDVVTCAVHLRVGLHTYFG